MKTIAHISDLHFGREDPAVVVGLGEDIRLHQPGLVAVSGDLTQRARRREFLAATAFLSSLPGTVLAVPGNHDIPLFNLVARFLDPLRGYRRHIAADPNPFFHDEELAAMGVNTARSGTWKHGRLSLAQIEAIQAGFAPLPERVFKVLVTHHPFVPAPGDRAPATVGRGLQALQVAEAAGVDLLLAGHLHAGFTADVRAHHVSLRRSMLVAQAGTATSHRRRGEPNSYNLITVDPPHLSFEVRAWNGTRFEGLALTRYAKRDHEWLKD